MKSMVLLCLILAMSMPAYAKKVKKFKPLTQPQIIDIERLKDNYYQQPTPIEKYPKITQLEEILFNKNYEKENIYSRLSRLENKIYKRNYRNMPLSERVENLLSNVDEGIIYGINQNELTKLETKVLGRTYTNDDTESRITRMEKEMLGAMQGGSLKERYETIKLASKHYNSYPEIVHSQTAYPPAYQYNPYSMYGSQSGTYRNGGLGCMVKNIVSSIFGGIGPGVMTGFTPSIYDPYSIYSPFPNQDMGTQEYYYGNRRQYYDNKNYGSQSTVRILD